MKRALALDMDDLIYPFMETLVPFHNERYGSNLCADDYFTFRFEDIWGSTTAETMRRIDECFHGLDELDAHPGPLTGADEAVPRLAQRYRLFIVTSRPDEFHARTTKWLTHHFEDTFEDVFLCNSYTDDDRSTKRSKASVVKQINAVGLVDDSAAHIHEVVNQGRTGILFGNYAWNRRSEVPEAAHRAANWNDVTAIFLGENS